MAKYSTVFFDADETLLDFLRSERAALTEALTSLGIPCPDETVTLYSGINASLWKMLERGEIEKSRLRVVRFEMLREKLGFDASPDEIAVAYTNSLGKQSFVLDGAVEICKKLAPHCRLYMVTNGLKDVQSGRLAGSGLLPYFSGVFVSEDVGIEKPDVRYFERVAAAIPNFDKKYTIIVGDSLTSDMKGGIAFGIDTCWFNPKEKERPTDMKLTYTVKNLSELEDIIL